MSHMVTVYPSGRRFEVADDQWLLDAALENDIPIPYNCRVGACGTCQVRLLSGEVAMTPDVVLSDEEIEAGYILACQARAKTDLEILIAEDAMQVIPARIDLLERLSPSIMHLRCTLDQGICYQPGQYAQVNRAGLDRPRAYSFASACQNQDKSQKQVDFFVRLVPGGRFTTWLFDEAKPGDTLELTGPFGTFGLRKDAAPMILVAGGSGLAPIKAIMEGALQLGLVRPAWLFFGVQTEKDLFDLQDIQRIQKAWPSSFSFVPVLSNEPADSPWQGARGFVHQVIAKTPQLPQNAEAYICGPPPMVDATVDTLSQLGLARDKIFADRFLDSRDLLQSVGSRKH